MDHGPEPFVIDIHKANSRILGYIEHYEVNVSAVAEDKRLELETVLKFKQRATESKTAALEKIYGLFERGVYDENEFVSRRDLAKSELKELEDEIAIIQLSLNNLNNEASPEKLNLLKIFSEVIQADGLTSEELNALYSSIIKAIYYTRDADDNVTLEIEYK